MKKRKQEAPTPSLHVQFETFRQLGAFELNGLRQDHPSCFNGIVAVKRFRITVEEIEEPKEILAARIQDLWEHTSNYHHAMPLQAMAKQIGYNLQGARGAKCSKKE